MPTTTGVTNPTLGSSAPSVTTNPYGHDLSCTNDLDPACLEVDGIRCLAEACFRRIITPRGSLIYDPNYGYDITSFLNADLTQGDIARISQGVDSELVKDERVSRSQTAATFGAGGALTLFTTITPAKGPNFNLVIAATAVTAQLLQVS